MSSKQSNSNPARPPAASRKAPAKATSQTLSVPKLTRREQEVLELMAKGLRNKTIAKRLIITERTVKVHVGNIFNKLNVNNRTEAVAVAMKMGLL